MPPTPMASSRPNNLLNLASRVSPWARASAAPAAKEAHTHRIIELVDGFHLLVIVPMATTTVRDPAARDEDEVDEEDEAGCAAEDDAGDCAWLHRVVQVGVCGRDGHCLVAFFKQVEASGDDFWGL